MARRLANRLLRGCCWPPSRVRNAACLPGGNAAAGPPTSTSFESSNNPRCVVAAGELTPYQSVAVPQGHGFVKTVRVDRGSRVRAGDVIAAPRGSGACGAAIRSAVEGPGGGSTAGCGAVESRCRHDHIRQVEGAAPTPGVGWQRRSSREKAAEVPESGGANTRASRPPVRGWRRSAKWKGIFATALSMAS